MPLRLSSIRHQCLCSNWTETHHRISRSWRSAASDFGLAEGSFTPPSALEIASREAEELAEAEKAEKHVLAFRREAIPIHGTIAETFLWGRGITCALPDTLRFRPRFLAPHRPPLPSHGGADHGASPGSPYIAPICAWTGQGRRMPSLPKRCWERQPAAACGLRTKSGRWWCPTASRPPWALASGLIRRPSPDLGRHVHQRHVGPAPAR